MNPTPAPASSDARPSPPANALSQPYWEAARQGRWVLQCCGACGRMRHYPTLLCPRCHSREVRWQEASGRGTVHSWTVAHHAFHASFAAELPYTLVTVDLVEGVRALGRWADPSPPAIGLPVRGRMVPRMDGVDLVFATGATVRLDVSPTAPSQGASLDD